MQLLVLGSLIAILILPCVLLYKRQMNISLGIFYILLCLGTLADLTGSNHQSIESLVWGTAGFALATGIEYTVRREFLLAGISSLTLLCFSCAIYAVAESGAFSV